MRRGEPDTRGSWPAVINLGVHSVFMRPIHPGEFLRDELDVLGVSPTELARRVKVLAVAHIASRLCQGGGVEGVARECLEMICKVEMAC